MMNLQKALTRKKEHIHLHVNFNSDMQSFSKPKRKFYLLVQQYTFIATIILITLGHGTIKLHFMSINRGATND